MRACPQVPMAEKAVGPYNSFSLSSPRSAILAATYIYKGKPQQRHKHAVQSLLL